MASVNLTLMSATPTTVHVGRCLHQRHQDASCGYCLESCPTGALRLSQRQILFNEQRCLGCGVCLVTCPVECFETEKWSERRLVSALEHLNQPAVEITCKNHPAPEVGQEVKPVVQIKTCLGAVSPGLWFEIGLKYSITVRLEYCSTCPMGDVQKYTRNAIGLANNWLEACGQKRISEEVITIQVKRDNLDNSIKRRVISAEMPIVNRRDFLFGFARSSGSTELAVTRLPNERIEGQKENLKPPHIPIWLRRLADVYPYLESDNLSDECEENEELSCFNWPAMHVSDGCVACQACSLSCPSGALVTEVVEGDYQHFFTPGICVACGLCALVCQMEAIDRSYDSDPNPFEKRVVADRMVHPCIKCGSPAVPESDQLCFCCGSEHIIQSVLDSARAHILNV